jgi:hypothetical protein
MLKLTFASLLLLSTSLPASAAIVIVGYNFNAANGVASTVDANATASNFTGGGGLGTVTFTTEVAAREFNTANYNAAVTAGDYFTFTATADAGYELNLTDLKLSEMRNTNGPTGFQINVNGTPVTPSLSTTATNTGHTILLSSFTGLSSATIQIVAWGGLSTGGMGTRNWFNDDVELNGTVDALVPVVPEASSLIVWSLLALTIGGACWWNRSTLAA